MSRLFDIEGLTSQEREMQKEVLKKFRSKISPSLAKIVKQSDAVRKQFVPSPYEALDFGTDAPFEEGKMNRGIYGLERIYEDRAVLTPYFECSAYCRYCFKKTRTLGGEAKRMSDDDIAAAIDYIRADSRIKTVLITGGDPLIEPQLLENVLQQVNQIEHVRNIRIGTRNILFAPENITDDLADMIAKYNYIDFGNPRQSKNISIGLSINHGDELTSEVVRASQKMIRRGLAIRGQMVLMKGINDEAKTIRELIELFNCVGIVPYYLFHCMPVIGAKHFRTSVQKGVDILRELSPLSGSLAPHYVYVTQVGKHRVGPNHPFTYVDIDGQSYIKATTPYKAADFMAYSDSEALPPLHEIDENGYIVSYYLDGHDQAEVLA
ncbi:KamA family radical SAM protein [Tumebacillus permanentifrigoris]|uniref:Lysine 2,3-aminomutase n=1 Tax=Tumebacillus permanentifrigoris TaxID=378543 RepID=A0A316D766_9BACL|nr:radical SAM protein [Tumebacillus permanentifrigoris]PWK07947.1 lysine 2,3-aminomutase [Tumebacillus permanentifrigoris]